MSIIEIGQSLLQGTMSDATISDIKIVLVSTLLNSVQHVTNTTTSSTATSSTNKIIMATLQ